MNIELAPLFVLAGQSLHACQMFEYTLCFLLALVRDHAAPGGDAFTTAWDFHSSRTLGDLVGRLGKEVELPPGLYEVLRAGVKARNRIVHGFMTERAMKIFDPKLRIEVVEELGSLRSSVFQGDRALEPFVDAMLKKYDVSTGGLKSVAAEMWRSKNLISASTQ